MDPPIKLNHFHTKYIDFGLDDGGGFGALA